MSENRGNKTRFARRRVYTVSAKLGFRSLNAMKCVYVGFSLSKQQSFFWKIPLSSCLIGLDQLHTGCTGGSAGWKGFNNIFLTNCFHRVPWTLRAGMSKVSNSIPRGTFFSSLLFFFSFSFYLVFFLFIAVLFCFFIKLKILRFINFLLYCLILPFPTEVLHEVLRFTYF